MKHYLIYKITNNLNGKFYIGKHFSEETKHKMSEAKKRYWAERKGITENE